MSEEDSSACTAPSYSVVESKKGHLVNHRLGVRYPERRATGYHSKKQYKERRLRRKEKEEAGRKEKEFLGAVDREHIQRTLQVEEVALCYPTEQQLLSPLKLHLAYKNEESRLFVFPLIVSRRSGEWHLSADTSGASFDSLQKLFNHYRLFRCMDIGPDGGNQLSLFPDRMSKEDLTVFASTPKKDQEFEF